jgi:hypothetical protein
MTDKNNSELLKGGDKDMPTIMIDSQYYRNQFDDWLAGGTVEDKGKTYYWSAQDSNYGFGWEIEPVTEEDWRDISEDEFSEITKLIERCLWEHKSEFRF